VILFVANVLGLGVQISIVTLLVCAVFGVPGAVVVILLALFDIAFAATVAPVHLT
jgi:inhibitor of the pro-sigma K processing machinery